jgi:thymidylate synthase
MTVIIDLKKMNGSQHLIHAKGCVTGPHWHFYRILYELWYKGKECSPRGLKVKELINYNYTLPPRVRFMCFNHRKLNIDYVKQEFMWYRNGDRKDTSIRHLAKMWDDLINTDGTINSNYGWYLFNVEACNSGHPNNFLRIVDELKKDPDSRRAAVCILNNDHLNSITKDYPCTSYLNFHIRENKLHMYVRMRSQDAIFGMGNDAPCFSFIHEMVWAALRNTYSALEMGNYHHTSDSFHVYERHYDMIQNILREPLVYEDYHDECPIMTSVMKPNTVDDNPFERWLLTRKDITTLISPEHL